MAKSLETLATEAGVEFVDLEGKCGWVHDSGSSEGFNTRQEALKDVVYSLGLRRRRHYSVPVL